jgi:energy-converting hydrogenase Eha subunit E
MNMVGASATQRTARGNGYIGSIVVNALLLYAVGHLGEWQIGWITPAWSDVVWALSLSLEVSIAANALFLVYDHNWFRYPLLAASSLVALQAVYVLYVVFPFDLGNSWNDITRLGLLALMLAIAIGTLVTIVLAVLHLAGTAAHELGPTA